MPASAGVSDTSSSSGILSIFESAQSRKPMAPKTATTAMTSSQMMILGPRRRAGGGVGASGTWGIWMVVIPRTSARGESTWIGREPGV